MSRPNPLVLALGLLSFVALFGGVTLVKGGLYLITHEGDTYHFLDILLRMQAGDLPHLDFPTPLGILGFLPVSALMEAGVTAGRAFMLAQTGLALLLLPLLVRIGVSRFSPALAWTFGFLVLGMVLTLNYGGTEGGVSISMHYNRWSWALAFVAIALAVLPESGRPRIWSEGLVIGLLGGALALMKMTYFVALGPGVLLAVWLRWRGRGLLAVLAGGTLMALTVTLAFGPAFWAAYLGDLRQVAGSVVRPSVGVPLAQIIGGAPYFGITLLATIMVLMVRRTEWMAAGTALLLLVPGFLYVTYQNYGNGPSWLWLLALLVLQLRPATGQGAWAGQDLRGLMSSAALAALALNLPALFYHVNAPIKNAIQDPERFLPALPDAPKYADVLLRHDRLYTTTVQVHLDEQIGAWSRYTEEVGRPPMPEFGGVTFAHCEWKAGSRAFFETITSDLIGGGLAPGSTVFLADAFSSLWMFGPFANPEGSAPWYYGEAQGLAASDYVAVPKCSNVIRVRNIMLADFAETGARFELLRESEVLALYSVTYPK